MKSEVERWREPQVLGIGDLHGAIAERFGAIFPDRVLVAGRVLEPRFSEDRLSFELLEPSNDRRSAVHVVLGPDQHARISQAQWPDVLEQVVAEGQMLVLSGRMEYWSEGRRVQITLDGIDREATLAARADDRAEARRRLHDDALYGRQATHAQLRLAPLRVSVVGEEQAELDDVVRILDGGGFALTHRLHVVSLSGRGSSTRLAAVIEQVGASGVDLVLVVHGPASDFKLAPFDSEVVARAIARSPVPVLTGIARPGDRTLADEVSYQALVSPSSAAAFVIGRLRSAHSELARALAGVEAAHRAARDRLSEARQRLTLMVATVFTAVLAMVSLVYAIRPQLSGWVAALVVVLAGGSAFGWRRRARLREPSSESRPSVGKLDFEASVGELERIVEELAAANRRRQVGELMAGAAEIQRYCQHLLGPGAT